ncbi:MAG: sigma-E factor negative regulatory protein [Pseudomonadales bacterium]|nr:sigma-E factor negative regulatory protein [Pseudomonadales bacterium]
MSEKLRESLSAVVDDEADEFELRRVVDELAKDPGLKASWDRYHMIGTVLRGEYAPNSAGLRERVWQELAIEGVAESESSAPEQAIAAGSAASPSRRPGRWLSLAVAAGVAFVVSIGVGNLDLAEDPPEVADVSAGVSDVRAAVNQAVVLKAVATPLDEMRTEAYKVAHSQYRGMNSPGPDAFAKMVSYQRQ